MLTRRRPTFARGWLLALPAWVALVGIGVAGCGWHDSPGAREGLRGTSALPRVHLEYGGDLYLRAAALGRPYTVTGLVLCADRVVTLTHVTANISGSVQVSRVGVWPHPGRKPEGLLSHGSLPAHYRPPVVGVVLNRCDPRPSVGTQSDGTALGLEFHRTASGSGAITGLSVSYRDNRGRDTTADVPLLAVLCDPDPQQLAEDEAAGVIPGPDRPLRQSCLA